MTTFRVCKAQRYARSPHCEEDGPVWDVVYRNQAGKVLDWHPACFRHGLAEVDAHNRAGGIATCDLVKHAESGLS